MVIPELHMPERRLPRIGKFLQKAVAPTIPDTYKELTMVKLLTHQNGTMHTIAYRRMSL